MVKIISDSTCDLSQEVLEKYDIDIIPLQCHLDKVFYDENSISYAVMH